jgi:hypothetical protein
MYIQLFPYFIEVTAEIRMIPPFKRRLRFSRIADDMYAFYFCRRLVNTIILSDMDMHSGIS